MSEKRLEPRATSEAVITSVVMPHDTNPLGILFGGRLMAWIDMVAGICAMRYAQTAVATAAVDALQFQQPIKLGWLVTSRAKVNYVGNTSCEIGVQVTAEDLQRGISVHAASAYLTMVSLDTAGQPCQLPPLLVQSDHEKQQQRAAETRRAMRLALQRRAEAEDKDRI